jgi:hypothetical protein
VGHATHELPAGYLGEIKDGLAALTEAEELLKGLSSEEDRLSLGADIVEERRLIEEHLRKQ